MGKKSPTSVKPVKGYVLVSPVEDQSSELVSISGDESTPQWGKVLAVGDSTWHEGIEKEYKAPCRKGDTIIHSSMGYEQIRLETEPYRLVPFGRILSVVRKS